MQTFTGLDEAQNPELETKDWKDQLAQTQKQQLADEHRKQSFLTPEYLSALPAKYGFNPQTFEEGDFEGMRTDILDKIENHNFRDERHKKTALRILKKNRVPWMLWKSMFDYMRGMTHPQERLSQTNVITNRGRK